MDRMSRPSFGAWQRRGLRAALLAAAAASVGCAVTQQPVVYQKPPANASAAVAAQKMHQQRVGADVRECRARADTAVGLNARRSPGAATAQAAQGTARAGAIGFVATAVGGLVASSKDVWQRARTGAAAGASGVAAKTLLEWNDPDKVYLEYVERCLEDRGHDVLGWR